MSGIDSVLLVGESNPYGSDPKYALYCEPPHSAGGRMCRLVCQLRRTNYLRLSRVNLCAGQTWDGLEAMKRARLLSVDPQYRSYVLLGRKVANAFNVSGPMFSTIAHLGWSASPKAVVLLPHPSGLSRIWNEPGAYERARKALRWAAPQVPWGETAGQAPGA